MLIKYKITISIVFSITKHTQYMTDFCNSFFLWAVFVLVFCQHCTILVCYNALVDQVVSRFVSISVLCILVF